jgi:hypothetical protein
MTKLNLCDVWLNPLKQNFVGIVLKISIPTSQKKRFFRLKKPTNKCILEKYETYERILKENAGYLNIKINYTNTNHFV